MHFQEVYDELNRFVYHLAHTKQSSSNVLMSADELVGELYEEMVKGFDTYGHLPKGQLLAVIRKMMDNRIAELTYRYFKTHRLASADKESLSAYLDDDHSERSAFHLEVTAQVVVGTAIQMDPQQVLESLNRVKETRERLSATGKLVFDAVLDGHPVLQQHVQLAGLRASFVYKGRGTVKVKEWHVADSLGIRLSDTRDAFMEICNVYKDVCNE